MQFIDLKTQQERIRGAIEARIQAVLNHGQYIMGPEINELEEKLSGHVGTKHAIGCASGTDALLLALMAYGVQPGDAVFTTPFTFIATAETIALLGAVPVFVDIDPVTFNLDVNRLEQAIGALDMHDPSLHPLPRGGREGNLAPRGIIAVNLFGLPCDYERIHGLAREHELFVIEDAAQSFGAEYEGKKSCSLGQIGCTSFFPAKPLGGYGDGGMCFTDDDHLAEKMRSLRVHGQGGHKYEHVAIGINGRLDALQAAILLAKFELFPEELDRRQEVARWYADRLAGEASPVIAPRVPENCLSAWAQYSVLARGEAERAALMDRLKKAQIPTAVYYPKPLHLQAAFAYLGYEAGDFPVSEKCAQTIFSLPMHPYLTHGDQAAIVKALLHRP